MCTFTEIENLIGSVVIEILKDTQNKPYYFA